MPRRNIISIRLEGLDNASPALQGFLKNLQKWSKRVLSIAAIVASLRLITRGINDLAKSAAEIEGVERAFISLTASVGMAHTEMLSSLRASSKGMVNNLDLMRSFNLATQLVSRQFATELPQAFELLTKVSLATGESMTYLMESLVRGIGRLNPRILDNLGVQIDLNAAYKQAAAEMGKTTNELGKMEKQTIAWSATLERLKINTAALPEVTGTLAYQYAVLQANIANVGIEIKRTFAPVLTNLFRRMNELIEGPMTGLGQIIRDWVAPGIDVLIDRFGALATKISEGMEKGAGAFIDKAKEIAWNALVWGNNIMINFADGIIRGATTAITTAMRFVGNLLSSWLMAKSPPKVAPSLREWGAAAFTEYLKGFHDAQFNVLEGLQAPIKRALQSLVDMGELAEDELGPAFVNISKSLAASIPEMVKTGKITEGIMKKIKDSVGGYADEILDLLQKQLNLADAVDKVRIAEENLEASRQAHEAAKNRIRDIANEYNRLLAAGAGEDVLAPLRDQFKEARKGLGVSREQVKESEAAKDAAEGRLDSLKEQVSLQDRLLDQLLSMAEALRPIAEAAAKKGKGVGGGILEDLVMPEVPGGLDLSAGLDAQFQLMKDKINALLDELLLPWKEKWEKEWKPMIDNAILEWDNFTSTVKLFWGERIQPIIDDINELIPSEGFIKNLGEVVGWFIVGATAVFAFKAALAGVAAVLSFINMPLLLIIATLAILKTAWDNNWFGMKDTLIGFWENTVKPTFENVKAFIEENLIPIIAGVGAALLTAFVIVGIPAIVSFAGTMATAAGLAAISAGTIIASLAPIILPILAIGAAIGLLVAAWQNDWLGIRTTLTEVWEGTLKPALMEIWSWLSEKIPEAIATVVNWWNTSLVPMLQTVWSWIKEKVTVALQALSDIWTNVLLPAVESVVAFFRDYYIPLFKSVMGFWVALGKLIVKFAVAFWENILLPALKEGARIVGEVLQPILDTLGEFWSETLLPIITDVATFVSGKLNEAWTGIGNALIWLKEDVLDPLKTTWDTVMAAISDAITKTLGPLKTAWDDIKEAMVKAKEWFDKIRDAISEIQLPGWLRGGSPPPLAYWLDDIASAASVATRSLEGMNMPLIATNLRPDMVGGNNSAGMQGGDTYNFNQTVNTRATQANTMRDFNMARALFAN